MPLTVCDREPQWTFTVLKRGNTTNIIYIVNPCTAMLTEDQHVHAGVEEIQYEIQL